MRMKQLAFLHNEAVTRGNRKDENLQMIGENFVESQGLFNWNAAKDLKTCESLKVQWKKAFDKSFITKEVREIFFRKSLKAFKIFEKNIQMKSS